ncbi:MAG: Uma2 family endonuclease [Saprospiraceae bacterium]|nr:Uma2 family endonuclease [Saprospiraceae bacterium]
MIEVISDIKQLTLTGTYTYADYLTWQFDHMVELIRGKIFKMSPAPDRMHQEIVSNLHGIIWTFLKDRQCRVYSAPFDVRLPLPQNGNDPDKIDTVVQPDICVICDSDKLDKRGCLGAPDWIIEILSESTAQKDLHEKFDIYQFSGVKEYWIVHPHEQTILIYVLNEEVGLYELARLTPFTANESIKSFVFPDLEFDLKDVWE